MILDEPATSTFCGVCGSLSFDSELLSVLAEDGVSRILSWLMMADAGLLRLLRSLVSFGALA